MNKLKTDELQSGSVLSDSLYLADNSDFIILPYQTLLPQELKDSLEYWGYRTIHTPGDGSLYENSDFVGVEFKITELDGVAYALDLYRQSCLEVTAIYDFYNEHHQLDIYRLTTLIKLLIFATKEYRRFVLRLNLYDSLRSDYFISHAVETTLLSLAIGEQLKLPLYKLIDLGIASLLHEIGLLHIPSVLTDNERPLSPEEQKMLTAHVAVGYKVLQDIKGIAGQPISFSNDILQAVLQHHERLDGSGYIQGLKGNNINMYSQIVGVACSYHAQIVSRPFRAAKDPHLSIVGMIRGMGMQYDEKILKVLVQIISIYPIGSIVKLSDSRTAQVVDTNPDDPIHPTVRILYGKDDTLVTTEQNIILTDQLRAVKMLNSRDQPARLS